VPLSLSAPPTRPTRVPRLDAQIARAMNHLLACFAMRRREHPYCSAVNISSNTRTGLIRKVPAFVESSPDRYALMGRLLISEDSFLRARGLSELGLQELKRVHFACYRELLQELRRDVRQSRHHKTFVVFHSECSLLHLGWLGVKCRLGMDVDVAQVSSLVQSVSFRGALPIRPVATARL
jgi:hypothetical protein